MGKHPKETDEQSMENRRPFTSTAASSGSDGGGGNGPPSVGFMRPIGERQQLTRRERECLRLASEGRTAWEIGQWLQISERISMFHLQNALRKLGTPGLPAATGEDPLQ